MTTETHTPPGEQAWTAPALPPRVGLNAIFLEPRMGGIDTYVRALVPEMARLAPEVSFSVFCNPRGREYLAAEGWGDAVQLVVHPLLGRRGLKAAGELTVLGAIAAHRVELLHSVALTGPLRTRAAHVVTLHDITWLLAPDPGEAGTVRLWRVVVPPVARRADRVIALTQDGAHQVVEQLRVPRDRIDVVAQGAGIGELQAPTPEGELRRRLGLGEGPVVLTVSAKKVNKNLLRVIEAMAAVGERWPDAVLVMPGNPTPHELQLRERARELGLEHRMIFPDYVSAADLEGLYALARCFVFASVSEGFGLPVLEAMRRGVPVACSRATSLPEVAGDAALYFDPLSVPDIGRALLALMEDQDLRADLIARGRERQARFTWAATARGTLDSYARAWAQKS